MTPSADSPRLPAEFLARLADVRWIAFDAVGTLIEPSPPVSRVYYDIGRRHGSRLSEAEIADRFPRAFRLADRPDATEITPEAAPRLETSEAAERAWWRAIVTSVLDDADDPGACFDELFDWFARPDAWRCFDDVGPALSRLRELGYRLAVASNFDRRLDAVCDALPPLGPIECRVISSVVGHRKPSAAFYAALARETGTAPAELLMVGDDLVNDIDGAAAAGHPALLVRRPAPTAAIPACRSLSGLVRALECRKRL